MSEPSSDSKSSQAKSKSLIQRLSGCFITDNYEIDNDATENDASDDISTKSDLVQPSSVLQSPSQPKLVEYPLSKGRRFNPAWYADWKWLQLGQGCSFLFLLSTFYSLRDEQKNFQRQFYYNWLHLMEKRATGIQ